MTVATYALGKPLAATQRGGDCRARDITQGRNVYGPHRFAATTDLQICNGMLRLTVGAANAIPTITVSCYVGGVTAVTGDYFVDTFADVFPGTTSTSAAGWQSMFSVTLDSASAGVTALLTGVRLVRASARAITVRLIVPAIDDVWITLRRGFRAFSAQSGDPRKVGGVSTLRRISMVGPPALTGTAYTGRVEETTPAQAGYPRFIASLDAATANAAAFTLTSAGLYSYARFGAGVATTATWDTPADHHAQLADATRSRLEVVST